MTATKFISIACDGLSLEEMKSVTSVKVSEDNDSDIVKTFDDPVTVPASDGGYDIDLDILKTRNLEDFITLRKILKKMKKVEGTLQVREIHQRQDGDVIEVNDFSGVLLSSNEFTLDAEDLSASSLSFKAKRLIEKINNVEIV